MGDDAKVYQRLAAVLLDLDRCAHGRHALDPCFGCPGGQSSGNLLLPVGMVIGYSLYGDPIVVPEACDRYDWRAWRIGGRGGAR